MDVPLTSSIFDHFQPLCRDISRDKYQQAGESRPLQVVRRVARAICAGDPGADVVMTEDAMERALLVPGGRILAGAGTAKAVTLMNCLGPDEQLFTAEHGLIRLADVVGQIVSVLAANGWHKARVSHFGRQWTQRITLMPRVNGQAKTRSKLRHTITATPDHRWVLADGSVTTALKRGDTVAAATAQPMRGGRSYDNGFVHGLIFADGTLHRVTKRAVAGGYLVGTRHYCARLCGKKADHVGRFEHVTYAPSHQGDPVVHVHTDDDLKSLPSGRCDVEYIAGFVDGWAAGDGHVPASGNPMITTSDETAVRWLVDHAPLAGLIATGNRIISSASGYANRKAPCRAVTLAPASAVTWQVEAIEPIGEADVYCAVVPGPNAFTLAGGVYTGNCYVMDTIKDDLGDIFRVLGESALTMQQGGGIGVDFSTLRPAGAVLVRTGSTASGPLTFMDVWDRMCRTIMSAGHRRGAMMATMRCDHPDIEAFIDAKKQGGRLEMFNLSVLVTDKFMTAVHSDAQWELGFAVPPADRPALNVRNGGWFVYKRVSARVLWRKILDATYDHAEPGVIFIDRVNEANNLAYCEQIDCTNPCAEEPLPPYGNCNLAAINLAQCVTAPWSFEANADLDLVRGAAALGVRFLDNVLDRSHYPLPKLREEAMAKRRIGLGVMGLANMLQQVGLRYGANDNARFQVDIAMRTLKNAAYLESAMIAKDKGPFPLYDRDKFLARPFIRGLDPDVQDAIAQHGIRNGVLLTIAPTGTTSIFAGNVSGGIEPVFAHRYTRQVLQPDGTRRPEQVYDWGFLEWCRHHGLAPSGGIATDWSKIAHPHMVTAQELTVDDHLAMLATAQTHIDASISKTINCPADMSREAFGDVYREAYALGCKSCTTYRPNPDSGRGAVLQVEPAGVPEADIEDPDHVVASADDSYLPRSSLWQRPRVLAGKTYKIKPGEHALYVTITDREDGGPAEIFITTKDASVHDWTQTVGRLLSAFMRNGIDIGFVADELQQVHSARGGWWDGGRYHVSVPAAIGAVLAEHIGAGPQRVQAPEAPKGECSRSTSGPSCPKCQAVGSVRHEGGCSTCVGCGWSTCG